MIYESHDPDLDNLKALVRSFKETGEKGSSMISPIFSTLSVAFDAVANVLERQQRQIDSLKQQVAEGKKHDLG